MYCFFSGKEKLGIAFLLLGALCIRLVMITLDPYLHSWDERFHALVAKNMMDNPWVPMLRVNPVIPYNYQDWCCNHIWVHKQPLFLWQMALSMKVFGVNEVALRLPSALLGVAGVWLVYRTGYLWLKDKTVAYLAAIFFALSHYQLELTSGLISLEHNDLVYGIYVLASIWAYMEYRSQPGKPYRWLVLIGVFVGCAVLNKWLTGLLVFAGWGTMLLLAPAERSNKTNWLHMALALLVAVVIFLPWQIYIAHRFPLETAWEQHFNYLHIVKALDGHKGDAWFHVRFMHTHYGTWLLPFMAVGFVWLLLKGWLKRPFTLEMLVMFFLIYLFFSQVKTKMPAFTFVVAPIGYIMVAFAIKQVGSWLGNLFNLSRVGPIAVLAIAIGLLGFRPWEIIKYRKLGNRERDDKIHNTLVYKEVGDLLPKDYVVFNCKAYEDIEMMFHTGLNAYHWAPEATLVDSLLDAGHQIAVFKDHGIHQLPEGILQHPGIVIIDKQLW